MAHRSEKRPPDPQKENSARIRREAGLLVALSALIPAAAALAAALRSPGEKK